MQRRSNEVIIFSSLESNASLLCLFVESNPMLVPISFASEAEAVDHLRQRRQHVAGIISDLDITDKLHQRRPMTSELLHTAARKAYRNIPFAIISNAPPEELLTMKASNPRVDYVASTQRFDTNLFQAWTERLATNKTRWWIPNPRF